MSQAVPDRLTWTLDDVIARAVAQHPSVEAASARVEAATGARRTAGTLPNPIGTYWLEHGLAGQGQTFGDSGSPSDLVRETQIYGTMPLEPLFQRAPRMRRADEEIKVAEAGVQVARRQVAIEAARLFFRVGLAQVSLDGAQQNRTGLEQVVAYNRARVSQGTTAELDLIRAQVELDRTATTIILSEVELARSRAELWAFLGFAADVPSGFVVTLPEATAAGGLAPLSDYVARAKQQRAEVVAAHARVAAAAADIDYQRRLSIRQLGATAGMKRTLGENSFLGAVSISIPLFDRNQGEIQRATGESLAAQKELALAERTVAAEVQAAYTSAQRLAGQITGLGNASVSRAGEANRITLAAYQQGAATLLQVFDTARALTDAQLTNQRLILAQRQSVLELALSVGNDPSAIGLPDSNQSRPITRIDTGDKR